MALFFGCSDDDDDDTWKQLPQEELNIQDVAFEINGEKATRGSLQMTVKNENEAVLNLKNVIPGYAEVPVDVNLKKQADNSFTFLGEQGLTTPPAMMVRSDLQPVIMTVRVEGNVNLEGKVSATATTKLSESAQAGLTGAWTLLGTMSNNDELVTASPLFLTWTAINKEEPNFEYGANMVSLFGSLAVYNMLNQVTFHEDGNITAKYWDGEFAMAGADENNVLEATHEDWKVSPKNLAFWYARNEMLYIVPNINAILQQVGADNEDVDINNPESLNTILEKLGEYNIDINALLPSVMQWMTTGIPVKYTKNGNELKISVDKQMVEPFMKALLPALGKLQEEVDKILADPTNDNSFLIQMALAMLRIEKLTDIKTIWEQNTAEFELSLNFVK
ncbi:DUF4925 domain-containing protein [Butyricimonas sp. NSJ-56]|uniref:DUF4925 domain-containing protein n=2 Tax=Butyricimonas hominis TaxID=2763032 RepID=A0ABR7D1K7_9BACT|nr:DUF4925 domain-containing protein [Butyricimonas hominis]